MMLLLSYQRVEIIMFMQHELQEKAKDGQIEL